MVPILLGGNTLNLGIAKWLVQRFGDLLIIDNNAQLPGRMLGLNGVRHLKLDYTDYEACLARIRTLIRASPGVVTSADEAVPTVARLNQHFGHKYLDLKTARNLLSKSWMQERWKAFGIQGPKGVVLKSNDALPESLYGDRLVIKPDQSSGSRGVFLTSELTSRQEFACALAEARLQSRNGCVRVEEYVEGTEFTVEMLADAYGAVTSFAASRKLHSRYAESSRVATILHYNPIDIADDVLASLHDFGAKCMTSLGLSATMGHLELIMRPNGQLVPLEIGARSSGFIASHLVSAVADLDYLESYFSVIQGHPLRKNTVFASRSSAYVFVDVPSGSRIGRLTSLDGLVPQEISVLEESVSGISPQTALSLREDSDRIGYVILSGDRSVLTPQAVLKLQSDLGKKLIIGTS